jgi:hypothetical protein
MYEQYVGNDGEESRGSLIAGTIFVFSSRN